MWKTLCVNKRKKCFTPPRKHPGKTFNFERAKDREEVLGKNDVNKSSYQVWLNHAVFHDTLMSSVVLKPYLFLSSVREPAHRFMSAWKWYHLSYRFNCSIIEFIDCLMQNKNTCKYTKEKVSFRSAFDSTSRELTGITKPNLFIDRDKANFMQNYKQRIRDILQFKLLLIIAERYDESIFVLKKIGNFSTQDIIYLPRKQQSSSLQKDIDEERLNFLNTMQPFDSILHKLANVVLDKIINIYTEEDIKQFQFFSKVQKDLVISCTKSNTILCREFRTEPRHLILAAK